MSGATPARVSRRRTLRPYTTTSGVLLAAASVPVGVANRVYFPITSAPRSTQLAALVAACLLALAGALVMHRSRAGRALGTVGIATTFALAVPRMVTAPVVALATSLMTMGSFVVLWKIGAPLLEINRLRQRPAHEGQAQGAAAVATLMWLLWTFGVAERSLVDSLVVGWSVAVSTLLALEWALRNMVTSRRRAVGLLLALLGAALVPLVLRDAWWRWSSFAGVACVAAALLGTPPEREIDRGSWWEPLLGHPERLLFGTFGALCVGGTVLLALPQSSATGQSLELVDAMFTAVSAVCVTGLAVLDTPVDFSLFGQAVILLLIQVGGLGIMTFSTVALWALGRRMSLRHEGAIASLISTRDRSRIHASARSILLMTLAVEGVGAVLLTVAFASMGDGLAMAAWRGLFTAVSAFCNAGFALQSASLVPYQHAPMVLHTVAGLVVIGSLSPAVVFALPAILRRSTRPIAAQVHLAFWATVVLLVGGFIAYLAFEWNDTLGPLRWLDKVHNAWFQTVAMRTAGFNSVDFTHLQPATLSVMLLWMFIGGNPGGTAGGVKTTTMALLALSVTQAMRGHWSLEVFGKRVPEHTRAKAIVVVVVSASMSLAALIAVQLTQDMSTRHAVFEVISALSTTGLSIGGTAHLDGIGKVILSACMFAGRLGGLTLLMFLSSRRARPRLGRPSEEIDVG